MTIPLENPYNLGTPIKNEWQFAGREAELRILDGCLDQVIQGAKLNVAIVGEPGMGKTSLLNIVECHARVRGILPVRLSLESEPTLRDLYFFRELYDKMLEESAKMGMFRWPPSAVDTIRRRLDFASLEVGESLLDTPLRFPRMFAECVSKETELPVMTSMLKSDLQWFSAEARQANVQAIGLMLDNCDYITRPILEKLKNLVVDLDGYFLFLAGSEKMLGIWHEVISPMPRVFLKVHLGPFAGVAETRTCVKQPLKRAKYEDVRILPDLYRELHTLTGGNPHEIQLLCHFMYLRLARGQATTLCLHPEVLESMVDQLEFVRSDLSEEKAFQKAVKKLGTSDIETAVDHLRFEGLSAEEQAVYELAFGETDDAALGEKIDEVRRNRKALAECRIIEELPNDLFAFGAGVFGRAYLKYYHEATTKSVSRRIGALTFTARSIENMLVGKFAAEFTQDLEEACTEADEDPWVPGLTLESRGLRALIDRFVRSVWERDIVRMKDSDLYFPLIVVREEQPDDAVSDDYHVMSLEVGCRQGRRIGLLYARRCGLDPHLVKERFMTLLSEKVASAEKYGITVQAGEVETIPGAIVKSARELDALADDLSATAVQVGEALLNNDPANAVAFAQEGLDLANKIKGNYVATALGDLGFSEMFAREFADGLSHTEEALGKSDEAQRAIYWANKAYGLATVAGSAEDLLEAEQAAKNAIDAASENPISTAWLLMIPFQINGVLAVREAGQDLVVDPVVDSVARCTLALLLAARGEHDEAHRMCDLAELRSGDRSFVLRTRSRVLLAAGELEPALDTLKRASGVEPTDPWSKTEYQKLRDHIAGSGNK